MTRRAWLLAVGIIFGCGRSTDFAVFSFPSTVGTGWKLGSAARASAEEAPEEARRLGLRGVARAVYKGEEDLTITVYHMTSQAGAFELNQKWRAEPDRLAFQRGEYFIVLESQGMENHALTAVAEEFEEALDKAR